MRATVAVAMVVCAGVARADECDVLTARIVEATGATVEKRVGEYVHLRHPLASSAAVLGCGPGTSRPNLYVSRQEAFPPPAFFDFVAQVAGLAVGASEAEIRAAALKCQRLALKDPEGSTYFDTKRFQMSCQEYTKPSPGRSGFQVFRR